MFSIPVRFQQYPSPIRICLLVCGIALAQGALSQKPVTQQLEALFNFYEKQGQFNGALLIAQKGTILLNKGYGKQDAALNKNNQPGSIFQVYSITKTFTATVILQLIEKGKLSLTDKLSRFYPDFPDGDSISIAYLLAHTSGIYDFTRGNDMPDQSEAAFMAFHKKMPLDFRPGTDFSYSNSGYYILGYIIEKVTGMRYEDAIAQFIFQPLQMQQSGFAFKHLQHKDKAIGYELLTRNVKKAAVVYDPPGPYAAGGIYSTVTDLYKYYQGLRTHVLLSKPMLDKAYTVVKNNYGYGWVVLPVFDRKTVGHSGAGDGFRSNFIQVPEDDICIILLSNTEKELNMMVQNIFSILYGKPCKIPVEKKISKKNLLQYVGTYAINDQFFVYVTYEDNKLMAQPSKQGKSILYAEKERVFYVMELNNYIEFTTNHRKQVDTLVLNMEGRATKAAKVYPSWGIAGSATANGWDGPDVQLVETAKRGIWAIRNIALNDGAIKFRFNNDWTINLGGEKGAVLRQEGSNIKIAKGRYDIILDLTDEAYPKYAVSKQE